MKSIHIFCLLTLAFLSRCSKNFLDQKPYTSFPIDEAIKTEAEMGAAMNGVYASMRGATVWGRNLPVFGEITKLELLHFVLYHTQRHIHQLKKILAAISNLSKHGLAMVQ